MHGTGASGMLPMLLSGLAGKYEDLACIIHSQHCCPFPECVRVYFPDFSLKEPLGASPPAKHASPPGSTSTLKHLSPKTPVDLIVVKVVDRASF